MNMKVKELIFASCMTLMLFNASTAIAKDWEINISIDNKYINLDDKAGCPIVDSTNKTLVPLNAVMEAFGAKVTWNDETNRAVVIKGNNKVELPIDANYMFVNGKYITTDSKAVLKDNKIYVQAREIVEALNGKVEWDQKTWTIAIREYAEGEVIPEDIKAKYITNATINATRVNVRKSPNLNASVAYKLNTGNRVNVVGIMGDWYQIADGNQKYYVFKDFANLDATVNAESLKSAFVMPTADMLSAANKKYYNKALGTDKWNDLILKVANEKGIDPVFIKVVMILESGGAQNLISANGKYYGLMQVDVNYGFDSQRILNDAEYAISIGADVIAGKARASKNAGKTPTCFEVAWRYNCYNEKGIPYANKFSSLYEELSGKNSNTVVFYN